MTNPYIAQLAEGLTLEEIGKRHGVSHAAVQLSLKRAGLPTTARGYLRLMNKRMLAPSVTRVVGAVA